MSKARELSQLGDKINIDDTTGNFSVDTDTLYVDVSANSVGIGTTSPSEELHITATIPTIRLEDSDDGSRAEILYNTTSGGLVLRSDQGADAGSASNIIMTVDGSEAMRIDSSGNLLVGKTITGATAAGMAWVSNEYLQLANTETGAGDRALLINRQSADGTLIEFRKANSIAGSIGTFNSDLNIGTGDTGVQFVDGSDAILPSSRTTNTFRDNAISLGNGGNRFKDLYLSGGVYLGGTGSANHLDDYEEGTFTPTLEGSGTQGVPNYVDQRGLYTKIGDMVHFSLFVGVSSWSTSPSGFIRIGNLPFSSSSVSGSATTGSVMHEDINTSGMTLVYYWPENTDEMRMYYLSDNAGWIQQSISNEAQEFYITGTYKAS